MKKFKDSATMKLLIIIGIVVLPLVYSLFYLKGFWDPYNSLDKVPVAIVNLDNCTKNCKSDELIETLENKKSFDFQEVSEKKADKGLIAEDYYAIIKIPENFTYSLENINTKDRTTPEIVYTTNTKSNYIMAQVVSTAMKEVKLELQSTINKKITKNLTDTLQNVPNQLTDLKNGLTTIKNGTTSLVTGSITLQSGISTINTSYQDFNNGVEKLYSGMNTLNDSYSQFNNGIDKIYEGAKTLKDSADSLTTISEKVEELKDGSDKYTSSLEEYQINSDAVLNITYEILNTLINYVNDNNITDQNIVEAYQKAIYLTTNDETGLNAITKIKESTSELVMGNQVINAGINEFSSGLSLLTELKTGIDELESALASLKENSNNVYTGLNTINVGLETLKESSDKIVAALSSLDSGAYKLVNGLTELENGTISAERTVAEKITETKKQTDNLTDLDEYSEEPVKVTEKDYGDVDNYGTFFSPYFMSLSLWVGGILILMGLYYDPEHRFQILGKDSISRNKRLIYYNIIGIVQAIMLGITLQILLDFKITNIFLYYGSCILISEAFLSIIMFLFFIFKDVGKFLSLIFLVLQLASCGGTFPVETEPSIYGTIYPFMPMTYSVDLLRESFVNINSNFLVKDSLILISIFVIFNILIFITGKIKAKKHLP